jgi:ankyrin repeat/BTB/POZ domain-containing protein 1
VIEDEDFKTIVKEYAEDVKERQETDTIPIIDDIRYHISAEELRSLYEVDHVQAKLQLIEDLLEELGLEA